MVIVGRRRSSRHGRSTLVFRRVVVAFGAYWWWWVSNLAQVEYRTLLRIEFKWIGGPTARLDSTQLPALAPPKLGQHTKLQ